MAETTGLVQRMTVLAASGQAYACAWVGPSPNNTELLVVPGDRSDPPHVGAFKNSMADSLVTAYLTRQEVVAEHDGSTILELRLEPS